MAKKKQQPISNPPNQEYVGSAFKTPRFGEVLPKESERQNSVVDMKPKKELHTAFLTEAHLGRALLLLDVNGSIKYCSPAMLNGFGASLHELVGKPVTDLLPEFPISQSAPDDNLVYASFLFRNSQWRACSGKDSQGRTLSLEATLMPLELEGRCLLLLELRTPHAHANEEEKLLRIQEVSELSGDAVAITDADGVIVYVNPAFEVLTGYRKEEVLGRTHAIVKAGVNEEKLYAQMWEVLQANATFRGQFMNRHKNGTHFYEDKIIRPFRNACGKTTHFIASGRDVSDRVQIMRRLEHFANYDGLTGLPNRNLFMDRLQQAQAHTFRSGEGFTLMLLDIDHFKTINDTFGHATGDAVLQTVASRLKQCLREEDTVARLGGDEFCLILEKSVLRRDVKKVLEKISALLSESLTIDGHNISIQASIGVAFYPEHGEDSHTLLKQADCAMYRVKANGGNAHLFVDKKETLRRAGNDGFFGGG
ncbi:diguanylate cyclase domain-containing protein [Sulfuriferula sp. GW1]|uniref:diguanylate cyclase domain-containing protein n=1 Tax=Sulfuriferula sp. GW1 TaxID=3345111 RepID=UPI0039AF04BA